MATMLVKDESTSGFSIKLYVDYSTSQDISTNKSIITVGMYVVTPGEAWDIGPWTDTAGSYVGTSSNTFNGSIPNFGGTRWLTSGQTFKVNHNSDGTGSATIYWKWGVRSKWGGYYEPSGSFTITLPTIARASQPSCITYPHNTQNVGDMGEEITIHMNKKSSSFTHTVKYSFGNITGTVSTGVIDNVRWTIPMSLANQIPSATSGTGTITVDTYNGGTKIGTKTCAFTCSVPSSVIPTISSFDVNLNNSNSVVNGWGIYVAGYSRAQLVASASGSYGSTISSFTISGDYSTTQNGSSLSWTGATIASSGSKTFTIVAKDSRGRTSIATSRDITVYAYSKPTVTLFTVERSPSDSTKMTVKVDWSYSTVNNNNLANAVLKYKKSTVSSWSTYGIIDKNSTVTLSSTFEEISSYNFKIIITDSLSNSAQEENFVSTIKVLLDFRAGGKGLGVGKIAETDNMEIALDTIFMGDIYIKVANSNVPLATYIQNVINGS